MDAFLRERPIHNPVHLRDSFNQKNKDQKKETLVDLLRTLEIAEEEPFQGLDRVNNYTPDNVLLGKSWANATAFTAFKAHLMEEAKPSTATSSTFNWTNFGPSVIPPLQPKAVNLRITIGGARPFDVPFEDKEKYINGSPSLPNVM